MKLYTYKEFENDCRKKFEKIFHTNFEKRKFSEEIPKIFDMVSKNGEIVGDAKYYKMIQSPSGKIATIFEYVYLLERCNANLRFLVFGNDIRVPKKWLKKYGHLLKDKEGKNSIKFYFLNHNTNELKELN